MPSAPWTFGAWRRHEDHGAVDCVLGLIEPFVFALAVKDPADADAFDETSGVADFFECADAAIFVDDVRNAYSSVFVLLCGRFGEEACARVPGPVLDAAGAHLLEEFDEDAACVFAFGCVHVDVDDGAG